MNLEKTIFGFVIVLALTLNVAFVVGEIEKHQHHNIWMLYVAILVNLIATGLKLGDLSQIGAVLLATSLVADLQLIVAAIVWKVASAGTGTMGPDVQAVVDIVSLASGALVANIVSVVMLVSDTLMSRR
jgi:hypothetical protein